MSVNQLLLCAWYSQPKDWYLGTGELGNKEEWRLSKFTTLFEIGQNTEKESWKLEETCCDSKLHLKTIIIENNNNNNK